MPIESEAMGSDSTLRQKAKRFRRKERLRDSVDLAGCLVLTLFLAALAAFGEVLLCRLGAAWLAVTQLYCGWRLFQFFRNAPSLDDPFAAHRHDLNQRLDFANDLLVLGDRISGLGILLSAAGWYLSAPADWIVPVSLVAAWAGMCFMKRDGLRRKTAKLRGELLALETAFPLA